ncbi:MAG: TetR family transcriptional regulator [Candidatus Eisenbacteria bacterium]|nr:TetR family transcriptional regulator [Candidatus Eisenbacteria bacterium]
MSATKREAICDAALGLFVEKGISGATTREIARRAGTAEGNLYRHFPGKTALARHLFHRCAESFHGALVEAAGDSTEPRETLRRLVEAMFDFAESQPQAFAYILLIHHTEFAGGAVENPQPLPKQVFVDVLRRGIRAGVFRDADPDLSTAWIVGLVQRAIVVLHAGRIEMDRSALMTATTAAALRVAGIAERRHLPCSSSP